MTYSESRAKINARYNAWAHAHPDKIREKNRRYREGVKLRKAAKLAEEKEGSETSAESNME